MSKEIERNTEEYFKDSDGVNVYCYLNTNTNTFFHTSKEIKETTNVDHLVRIEQLDFWVRGEIRSETMTEQKYEVKRLREALKEVKKVAHGCCVCDESWGIADLALMSQEDRDAEMKLREDCEEG